MIVTSDYDIALNILLDSGTIGELRSILGKSKVFINITTVLSLSGLVGDRIWAFWRDSGPCLSPSLAQRRQKEQERRIIPVKRS